MHNIVPDTAALADKGVSEVLICISADSRAEVDDMVERAAAAGGVADPSPIDEYSFMYGRSFEDPDGHVWGVNWLDMAALGDQHAAEAAAASVAS